MTIHDPFWGDTSLKKLGYYSLLPFTARDFVLTDGPKIEKSRKSRVDHSQVVSNFVGRYQVRRNSQKASFEPKTIGIGFDVLRKSYFDV